VNRALAQLTVGVLVGVISGVGVTIIVRGGLSASAPVGEGILATASPGVNDQRGVPHPRLLPAQPCIEQEILCPPYLAAFRRDEGYAVGGAVVLATRGGLQTAERPLAALLLCRRAAPCAGRG